MLSGQVALLLVACGTGAGEPAPVPVVEVPATPESSASPAAVPATPGGVRVLHQRVAKGRNVPTHVSATWVGDGASSALQVMVTGLLRACAPAPTFSVVMAGDQVRLVEAPFEPEGDCKGSHTIMLELEGQEARDLTVSVVRADGSELGSTEVGAEDH